MFILSFIFLSQAFGQVLSNDPNLESWQKLNQSGKMISIQLVPKEPLKIYVVGREEAKIDLKNMKVTIKRLTPAPAKSFTAELRNDYFIAKDVLKPKEDIEIKVIAEPKNSKPETFNFKIRNRLD